MSETAKIKETINTQVMDCAGKGKPLAVATVKAYWKSYALKPVSKPEPTPKSADKKTGDIY